HPPGCARTDGHDAPEPDLPEVGGRKPPGRRGRRKARRAPLHRGDAVTSYVELRTVFPEKPAWSPEPSAPSLPQPSTRPSELRKGREDEGQHPSGDGGREVKGCFSAFSCAARCSGPVCVTVSRTRPARLERSTRFSSSSSPSCSRRAPSPWALPSTTSCRQEPTVSTAHLVPARDASKS